MGNLFQLKSFDGYARNQRESGERDPNQELETTYTARIITDTH